MTTRHLQSHIYLIQDGTDIGTSVYKIGKTSRRGEDSRVLCRLKDYSEGTMQHASFSVPCAYVDEIEQLIIREFSQKFKLVRGREWFEGVMYEMRKLMSALIEDFLESVPNAPSLNKEGNNAVQTKSITSKTRCGTLTKQVQKKREELKDVKVHPFGHEDISYMTDEFKESQQNVSLETALYNYIKETHFNSEHPENQNVQLIDGSKMCLVYTENHEWELVSFKYIVHHIVIRSEINFMTHVHTQDKMNKKTIELQNLCLKLKQFREEKELSGFNNIVRNIHMLMDTFGK